MTPIWEDGCTAVTLWQRGAVAFCLCVKSVCLLPRWLYEGRRLVAANVGDSRVVISSNKKAVALSEDHKPTNRKERDRIQKAGGRVIDCRGVWRVNGVLAIARAIGDFSLKPFVSPEPEFREHDLGPGDEFAVLASDGLWDVLSNQQAVDLVEANWEDYLNGEASLKDIAELLTKAALAKGSQDNITAVVAKLTFSETNSMSSQFLAPTEKSTPIPKVSAERKAAVAAAASHPAPIEKALSDVEKIAPVTPANAPRAHNNREAYLTSQVSPVLRQLLQQTVAERPTNVLDFMIRTLTANSKAA